MKLLTSGYKFYYFFPDQITQNPQKWLIDKSRYTM